MVTASADQTVRLWDLNDRNQAQLVGPPLAGHTDAALAVAFASDGRTLATGGADGTVMLWELAELDRQVGPPLTGHPRGGPGGGIHPGWAHPGDRQRKRNR
jgi:WD40 repeat protein